MKIKFDVGIDVGTFLDSLTEGQRAYLFNKMLKEMHFSPQHTSIRKLARAIEWCAEAQHVNAVEGYFGNDN